MRDNDQDRVVLPLKFEQQFADRAGRGPVDARPQSLPGVLGQTALRGSDAGWRSSSASTAIALRLAEAKSSGGRVSSDDLLIDLAEGDPGTVE